MNNVVGKMLIVMQLVFSVLFMCFAGAVYSFQGQWRAKAEQMEKDLEVARQQTAEAGEARNREVTALKAEIVALADRRDTLTAERQSFEDQFESAKKLLELAQLERDKAIGDSEVASTEAAARIVEAAVLNTEVRSLEDRMAERFAQLQELEDLQLSLSGKLAAAEEKQEEHLTENSRLKDVLRINKIDPRTAVVGDVPAATDKVDGFVDNTLRNKARTQEYLSITIGSDDNVYKDMKLIVSRGAKYICQARVVKVEADSAVCIVDEETRQGTIERGDNVTTKL